MVYKPLWAKPNCKVARRYTESTTSGRVEAIQKRLNLITTSPVP